MAAAVPLKGQLLCKEQEQVQTVSEVIGLDIFTAMFSSNHRLSFAVLLLLSNSSHIYVYLWVSSASRSPTGKPARSLHSGQSSRLYFMSHWTRVQYNCMWELCIDLQTSFPKVTLQVLPLTASTLLNLFISSVFQKVALTVYRCDSVMQIVFSVYLIWCWQE